MNAHKSDDNLITLGVSLLLTTVMLYAMGMWFWRSSNVNISNIGYPAIANTPDRHPTPVLAQVQPDRSNHDPFRYLPSSPKGALLGIHLSWAVLPRWGFRQQENEPKQTRQQFCATCKRTKTLPPLASR